MAAERMTINKLHDFVKEKFNKVTEDIELMKDQIIKNLVENNKKLQEKVENLEKQIKNQEEYMEANNQYHRRNNLEIHGIPNEVKDEDLEDKVIEILGKIDVTVEKSEIEACHRLPPTRNNKTKKTIVRFINRKKPEKSLKSKKKLQNLNMNSLKFPEHSKIFLSDNLNRFFQKLAWHCRTLKRNHLIYSFKFQHEAFYIKTDKDENSKKITHEQQLFTLFPGFFVDNIIYS